MGFLARAAGKEDSKAFQALEDAEAKVQSSLAVEREISDLREMMESGGLNPEQERRL